MAYVGQTGRSLRERLLALIRHTLWDEMPWNDPHTAAPALWSYWDADGLEYEHSATPIDLPAPGRLGLECQLLWQYRLWKGESSLCNFGRLHPRYVKSRNRSTGWRGGKLPMGRINQAHAESLPPLVAMGKPQDAFWMGAQCRSWDLASDWVIQRINPNQWSQRGPGSRPST